MPDCNCSEGYDLRTVARQKNIFASRTIPRPSLCRRKKGSTTKEDPAMDANWRPGDTRTERDTPGTVFIASFATKIKKWWCLII